MKVRDLLAILNDLNPDHLILVQDDWGYRTPQDVETLRVSRDQLAHISGEEPDGQLTFLAVTIC